MDFNGTNIPSPLAILIFAVSLFTGADCIAINSQARITPNEFIKEWLICGPFMPDFEESDKTAQIRYTTDFLKTAGGKTRTGFYEGQEFSFNGKEYQWKKYSSPKPYVDLKSIKICSGKISNTFLKLTIIMR